MTLQDIIDSTPLGKANIYVPGIDEPITKMELETLHDLKVKPTLRPKHFDKLSIYRLALVLRANVNEKLMEAQ